MYQKNCDQCQRPSFSSSEQGDWLCPVCGNALTHQPFFNAMTQERVNVSYKVNTQKKQKQMGTLYQSSALKDEKSINLII
ncbi:hypothetical protein [Cytobacillus gottheilii]|uniref:Uncharacterized protein n=1 Tax=Cytobacillus gottheilii TaxID=859144 RepID=A0ABX8FE85_9BACI|nr:hypothetical protein [Cytobacillus gottheilii]QVY62319.1 hypothetical protein J1899_04225 [Cytobacillus gottheilii]